MIIVSRLLFEITINKVMFFRWEGFPINVEYIKYRAEKDFGNLPGKQVDKCARPWAG